MLWGSIRLQHDGSNSKYWRYRQGPIAGADQSHQCLSCLSLAIVIACQCLYIKWGIPLHVETFLGPLLYSQIVYARLPARLISGSPHPATPYLNARLDFDYHRMAIHLATRVSQRMVVTEYY